MNIPEIAKCPACKCDVAYSEELKTMQCQVCPYDAGGDNETEAEAIAVHERICRQPTPEAADRDERDMEQLCEERDDAEQSFSQAYFLVTGKSPEWSNLFGAEEALEEIQDALELLRKSAHPPKPEPTEAAVHKDWCASRREDRMNDEGSRTLVRPCNCNPSAAPKPPAEWVEALAKDLLQVVLFADPDRMPFSFEGALEIIQRHAPRFRREINEH